MNELLDRTWRDAKIPKWVTESIEADLEAYKITTALSWPTEAKPKPVPFQWGEYDHLYGEPVEGTYWSISRGVHPVSIRKRTDEDPGWKTWLFRHPHSDWTTSVTRGRLYRTEQEATLAWLWDECEIAAKRLKNIRERMV